MKFPSFRCVRFRPRTLRFGSGTVFFGQRGVALIITLLVVTLLITLILEFGNTMRIEARAAANFRDDLKAYYIARAGVSFARGVLEEDAKEDAAKGAGQAYDALTEFWAQKSPPIPLGDGFVSVEIMDENGKIYINEMKCDINNLSWKEVENLLEQSGRERGMAGAIADWIDDKEIECSEGDGAESNYYESLEDPYEVKNLPLDSLDELRLIKGVDDEVFHDLKNFLTIHGDAKINLNTAPLEVLKAALGDEGESLAQGILECRKETPFKGWDDLGCVTSDVNAVTNFKLIGKLQSDYFSIQARGEVNDVRKFIHAIVKRESNGKTTVRYWRVE